MQQRIPLAAIAPGETVRVAEIRVEGALRRRLFDLGLIFRRRSFRAALPRLRAHRWPSRCAAPSLR